MVISSAGYPGTVNAEEWAKLIPYAGGSQYGVSGVNDWKVEAGAGVRQVVILAGTGWGHGVIDVSSAAESVTLDAVPTGARYDLIVARRDWGSGETTFGYVQGGSSRSIPGRTASPGEIDEQPIALVRVTAGATAVSDIVDLRVWPGDGSVLATDELVLQYLTRLGTSVRVGRSRWERALNTLGQPAWLQLASIDGFVYIPNSSGVNVSLPAGLFSQAPLVFATPQSPGVVVVPHVTAITASSFLLRLFTLSGVSVTGNCAWEARQRTNGFG